MTSWFFPKLTSELTRSTSVFPLLSLPQELQDRVWDFAIGNLDIHITRHERDSPCTDSSIDYSTDSSTDSSSTDSCSTDSSPPDLSEEKSKYVFSYFLCQGYPSRARQIYYKDVDLPSKPQSLSDIGHVSCNPSKIHQRDHEMAFSTRPQRTSLLLVCKHIHLSASRILYSSNTWCFTEDIDPFETLPMFCASLSPSASASLRKVVLVLPLTRDYWDDV